MIAIIGTFDTKGPEHAFLRDQILALGEPVLTMNVGIQGTTSLFPVDVEADEIWSNAGHDRNTLPAQADRGRAIAAMSAGAAVTARRLFDQGELQAIVGMGGSGGTSIITAAMRALPYSVPKLCVTTLAAGDVSGYLGIKDVVLLPSITDVAGVNRISRMVISRAAGAIVGMLRAVIRPGDHQGQPVIAASMFGNTTRCVEGCRERLERAGYEVLVFHATGTGGRIMESLIDDGLVDGCLDITTTEWADTLCGGILSAGDDRLSAPGRRQIPHLIVPGCLDMVNFGPLPSVPDHFRSAGRRFHEWSPEVTLMRTDVEENRRLGQIIADKANQARGPVRILLPLRGISLLDADGGPFCDRVADGALFTSLKDHLRPDILVEEVDANINDLSFVERAVAHMLEMMKHGS